MGPKNLCFQQVLSVCCGWCGDHTWRTTPPIWQGPFCPEEGHHCCIWKPKQRAWGGVGERRGQSWCPRGSLVVSQGERED